MVQVEEFAGLVNKRRADHHPCVWAALAINFVSSQSVKRVIMSSLHEGV